ncbi:MAG: hypothetical protein EPN88_03350 [Bacteroidetes bacterium]|nr:MAG: hypothetical protein EPN88_03350 [Bacteroidota bacterium]
MKASPGKIALISLLILVIAGCKKNYTVSNKQVILFQFEYINYAWGYQHNGFFIDTEGNVLKYSNPENWNFPDNDLSLSESQVAENLAKCVQTSKKISKGELRKYTDHIDNIASSKVTALKNVAADAGSSEFICYQFSENTGIYKGHLIKMEGDFTCENLNFYSKKVTLWMKEIKIAISGN